MNVTFLTRSVDNSDRPGLQCRHTSVEVHTTMPREELKGLAEMPAGALTGKSCD